MRAVNPNLSVAILIFLFQALAAPGIAGELQERNVAPADNIGFEIPVSELQERFSMCDAFLKVDWIDRAKKIGYSRYDLYGEKGHKLTMEVNAIVDLDDYYPRYDYSATEFLEHDRGGTQKHLYMPIERVNELFGFVRSGTIDRTGSSLRIMGNDKALSFMPIGAVRDESLRVSTPYDLSLSGYRNNVCILYPNNEKVWIAEFRRIENAYSKEVAEQLFAKLAAMLPQVFEPEVHGFGNGFVLDINFDGIEDYYVGEFIYSHGGKYYATEPAWKSGADRLYGKWIFRPSKKMCDLNTAGGQLNMTTDGKNYFVGNHCNLTDLAK